MTRGYGRALLLALLLSTIVLVLAACNMASGEMVAVADAAPAPMSSATAISTATPTATASPAATHTPEPALTPTPEPTAAPAPTYPLVAIDPGHGGDDLGARRWVDGHMAGTEAEVNLALALRVRDLLVARGIPVYLTRDADYALLEPRVDINDSGEDDYVDEAQARVDAINVTDAVVLLSIHQNAFEWPDGSLAPDIGGTVVYYCVDRSFADESLRLAELVHEQILLAFAELGHEVRDRGVWDDYVLKEDGEPGEHLLLLGPESERIVRPSQVPGVLSETLFITHEVEGALASDPAALDRLAEAYADALQAYLDGASAGD